MGLKSMLRRHLLSKLGSKRTMRAKTLGFNAKSGAVENHLLPKKIAVSKLALGNVS